MDALPVEAPPSFVEDLISVTKASYRLSLIVLSFLAGVVSRVLGWATFTLPRFVYAVLSWGATFTLQLNFAKVAIALLIGTTILSYAWKVRYLNRYTFLKEQPLKKDEGLDLHPDLAKDQAQPSFHNYLDEFLSAIKVFGYLEKPVFHELARHLQTKRLIAGDTINLDTDKSFYIVIDGCVQVFAKTGTAQGKSSTIYDDEDVNGYQLLNNVENGGTLSSLFTILSLFTEDVQLRYEDDVMNPTMLSPQQHAVRKDRDPDVSDFSLDPRAAVKSRRRRPSANGHSHLASPSPQRARRSFSAASESTIEPDSSDSPTEPTEELAVDATPVVPKRPLLATVPSSGPNTPGSHPMTDEEEGRKSRRNDALPSNPEGTIARAKVDTTLAVIPAEAFRRLTKKFPNAAAHIVQVILTRLQRVTFLTAHKYLGLTREVLRTEKAINDLACYPLPETFWASGGMQRLRQRFVPETKLTSPSEEERHDYFELDTPYAGPRMGQSFWADDHEAADGIKLRTRTPGLLRKSSANKRAGDLLSMSRAREEPDTKPTPLNRNESFQPRMSWTNEDFDLRDSVMDCISKAIGLVQPHVTPAHSLETSPMVRPEQYLQKAVFNSSFGSLSFLGLQGVDDESSVTGSTAASHVSASELENEVEIRYFAKDSVLVREGEKNAGLYFVIEGFLEVSCPETPSSFDDWKATSFDGASEPNKASRKSNASAVGSSASSVLDDSTKQDPTDPHNKAKSPLFTIRPGGIAGYLSSLSGFPSYVDIVAKTECYVGFLPAKALERIMDRKPIVLLTLAKRLISLLSPLVLHIDSALDWQHVSAGQVIYREGDPADSFHIVINGRLRSISEKIGGGVQILDEYGQGESVGELDCITASPRPSTLHAIRDSELARMPMTLFNAISVRHPLVTIQISRIIATRVRQRLDQKMSIPPTITSRGPTDIASNTMNLKTVAILPSNRHVPVSDFASKLFSALENMGAPTSYLNQATVMQVLGRHAFSRMGSLKLAGWLSETEQKYRIVLYVADTAVSATWTQTCIRQADCILVVADSGSDPDLGEYEKLLVSMKITARKELVLLHPERLVPSGSTRLWLQKRPWIHAHHHVELEGATAPIAHPLILDPAPVVALRKIAKRVEVQLGKYRKSVPRPTPQRSPATSDFARLARRLCGKSIGLILGGGGARGISHIGVLQALQDRGIPVDLVGGTSIGSFVGGLYAREGDLVSTYGRAKRFSGRMSTLWRILTDLTYPVVAYTTGHEFNRGIYKSFYDVHIEDMWLPFFCNTTNITHSRMDVHTSGYAWRYVRASMSLAGLLPPLCDQGDMLVDGGYVDNLPVSVIKSMGASHVFAIDVGAVDDTNPRNFGESISGWWVLIQRWNPFSDASNIPSITEIQSRLTYVSSVKTLEEAKATPGVLYMRMPVTHIGTMEFKRFDEVFKLGHQAGSEMLEKFAKEGKVPNGLEGKVSEEKIKKRGQSARRNSI